MKYNLNIQKFGGRGQSVINPDRRRLPNPPERPELDPNATFENTIGERGDAIAISVAEEEVNPNFRDADKWRINCQRCAFTNEFERRGYNVTALPNTGKYPWYSMKYGIEEVMGRDFDDMGGSNIDNTIFNIAYTMKNYGVGARGFIMMYWKRGGGHIFNIEQTEAGTEFIDAQTHKTIDIRDYLKDANLDSVAIARVDDIPTENFDPGHLKNIMKISSKNLNHN